MCQAVRGKDEGCGREEGAVSKRNFRQRDFARDPIKLPAIRRMGFVNGTGDIYSTKYGDAYAIIDFLRLSGPQLLNVRDTTLIPI